jgi:hypothetical protein
MKKITTLFSLAAVIIFIACNNSDAAKNNKEAANISTEQEADAGKSIVGTWIPIGVDFNMDGKTTPSGNWKYYGKVEEDAIKEAGLTPEAGYFTFKANGTGFMGKAEPKDGDGVFKYKKLAMGKWCMADTEEINTNAKNIALWYLDAKGQLIHHTSSEPTLLGKKEIQK